MPNENENTSNELDALFTTSDSSEGEDDFFSLGAETTDAAKSEDSGSVEIEVESNPFGASEASLIDALSDFGTIDADSKSIEIEIESNPLDASDSSSTDAPSDVSPFGNPAVEGESDAVPTSAPVAEEPDKKGKKGKKEKTPKKEKAPKKEKTPKEPKAKGAKKEKVPKEPKAKGVKKEKAPKEQKEKRPYVDSPLPVYVLFGALALFVVCVVVASFAIGGGGAIMFLIPAGIFALVMLAVPFMLLSHLRKEPIGLFDMAMAVAAIFAVASAIVVLAYQAKTYGASSKVALNVPAVVASLDC